MSRRRFLQLTGVTAAGLMTGYCGQSDTGPEISLALTNGTLIDGTGAKAVTDAAVVISDGRIAAAGPRTEVEIPATAEVIDLNGMTMLPGFINAHVHNAYDKKILRAWAQGGVTTVRDLGVIRPFLHPAHYFKRRDELCADPKCARLTAVGPFVNVEGGYPVVRWGGEMITIDSPEDARIKVDHLIDSGADVIKTVMESGDMFRQSDWPLLSSDEIKAIVETAHERHIPVTVHVTSAKDLGPVMDSGADEIAHMVVDDLSNNLVSRMVETGTRWVPTIELWQLVSRISALAYGKNAIRNLALFVEAGGEVVLGTDYAGAPGVTFDLGMPIREIGWMQEAGMTPMQIIVAATQNGARSCNLLDEVGTLEEGKLADIIVVDGNPLIELQALSRIKMVFREGKSIFLPIKPLQRTYF
jgi:imidazolonepropionase-like amidohydrolase